MVNNAVQIGQVGAPDPQQIIGLAGQCPCRDDLWASGDQAAETAGHFGRMAGHLHLHKSLHRKTQFGGVQPGGIANDKAFGFQPRSPSRRLTGRQVQQVAQLLRGQHGVGLDFGQDPGIGGI